MRAPDHLVVVEAHSPVGDGACAGLAHVVEERGQPEHAVLGGLVDHGQGVRQDVLVPVDGVLLDGQGRELGQELGGQPRADHEPQRLRGHVDHDHLVELVADALGRDDRQPSAHALDGGDQGGVGRQREARREARRTEHAQGVVPEGHLRVERGTQPARGQVAQPVEGVDEPHVGQVQRQGVDGEVPP